jgi:hypothetical protein
LRQSQRCGSPQMMSARSAFFPKQSVSRITRSAEAPGVRVLDPQGFSIACTQHHRGLNIVTIHVGRARFEYSPSLRFQFGGSSLESSTLSRGRDRPVGRRRRSNRPGNSQAQEPRDGQDSGKWRLMRPPTG